MVLSVIALLATCAAAAAAQTATSPATPPALTRVAEEAEVLQENIPKALTMETLVQRTILPPSRFQPRIGSAAIPKVRERVREIVSEYSVAALRDSESHDLVEFRQVVSVDGKPVQTAESARHALSLGVKSADERTRKRMLEEFAKSGLVDIASDYGLILLAFSRRGLENIEIQPGGEGLIGAEAVDILAWKQKTPEGGELEFHGRQSLHLPLAGLLWVRHSDGLPLRVQAYAESVDRAKHLVRDDATVDYVRSPHGFLAPASVVHHHIVDSVTVTENTYSYEPFKLFSSDAEIKFTEIPESTPPVKKK
jgi:hypothetical protein